jgi:hypothetical protein
MLELSRYVFLLGAAPYLLPLFVLSSVLFMFD